MHGVKTGSRGLHAIVRDWAKAGTMTKLISNLINEGFQVTLTSDHGNIQGKGIGKPNVGVVADEVETEMEKRRTNAARGDAVPT